MTKDCITKLEQGFEKLNVDSQYKNIALANIKKWLSEEMFASYQSQIKYLIDNGKFDVLLDSFYQVLPFGTGGRRGPVGIGPNRLNPWNIQASAQGHSEYLLGKFGEDAKKRGIVFCYDVRKYPETGIYCEELENPIKGITSRDFALAAIEVYTANGIKCYLFEDVRATPELSFAIRELKAVAGIVISASHNPKEDSGKKVYSDDGSQLVPPEDHELSDVVGQVKKIKSISVDEARKQGLLEEVGEHIDNAYIAANNTLSLLESSFPIDKVGIVYSPLHGVGKTSVYKSLSAQGFCVTLEETTADPDGTFPNVKFNIPNPEVVESMDTLIKKGREIDADLLINSDPDADRLGVSAKASGSGADNQYRYFNGNEIGILVTHFVLEQLHKQQKLPKDGVIAKTTVTSELIAQIAKSFDVTVVGDLMVGLKYIANEIRKLEQQKARDRFIMGMEESHGYLIGTHCRDKDAAGASLVISELAAVLKSQNTTMEEYLNGIYCKFGYCFNKQSSLIFLGAEGKEKIDKISATLRENPPTQIGPYQVDKYVDRWQDAPFLSPTDKSSRNVQTFYLQAPQEVASIKITIRPSGTEPKTKIYVEIGGHPISEKGNLAAQREQIHRLATKVIGYFTAVAYDCVGIQMEERGYLLSNLLPVEIRLKYFGVEKELLELEPKVAAQEISKEATKTLVDKALSVFGKDPVEKISAAFEEKTGQPLAEFLEQKLKI